MRNEYPRDVSSLTKLNGAVLFFFCSLSVLVYNSQIVAFCLFFFLNGQIRLNFSFTNAPHILSLPLPAMIWNTHWSLKNYRASSATVWTYMFWLCTRHCVELFTCLLPLVYHLPFQLFFGQSCNAMSYFLFPHCDEHYIISIRVLTFQFFSAERGTCRYQQS